jgi:uncharacterized membrane protein (UPF0127 family)
MRSRYLDNTARPGYNGVTMDKVDRDRHKEVGQKPVIRVENVTRGQTLVSAGAVADNPWTRLRGLIGRSGLAPGEGLLIVPCNSIHMFFMRFAIDVLYVDRARRVVGLHHTLAPWRVGRMYRQAHFVVELPAGTLRATGTEVGDQLRVIGYPIGVAQE